MYKTGFLFIYMCFNYQFFVFHFIFLLFKATLRERLTLVPRKLNTAGSFCWPGKGPGGVGGAGRRYCIWKICFANIESEKGPFGFLIARTGGDTRRQRCRDIGVHQKKTVLHLYSSKGLSRARRWGLTEHEGRSLRSRWPFAGYTICNSPVIESFIQENIRNEQDLKSHVCISYTHIHTEENPSLKTPRGVGSLPYHPLSSSVCLF